MNPQLQITFFPGDRDASLFVAAGENLFPPRGVSARDLPPDFLEVWHAFVSGMEAADPGGWAATFVVVDPCERVTVGCTPEAVAVRVPILCCSVSREREDGSPCEPLSFVLDDAASLYFFRALTSPSFWAGRGIAPIQQGFRHFQFHI